MGDFWPGGHYLNILGRGPLGKALHTKYERSTLSCFREEDFLRFSYEKHISPGGVAIFGPGS